MRTDPAYYRDFLAWALREIALRDEPVKTALISEVWGILESVIAAVMVARPLTLRTALKLVRARWDPLEDARNRMERIMKTYGSRPA